MPDARAEPVSYDELEIVEVEPDTPAPTGERRPSAVEIDIPWAPPSDPPSAEPAPNTWPAESPTRVRHEVERATSRMRRHEIPSWVVQVAKWAAAPVLAAVMAGVGYLNAKAQLVREEAARVAADRAAKDSDKGAIRNRLSAVEGNVATLQSQLAEARQKVADLERERSEAPLEVNPRKKRTRTQPAP